MRLLEQQTRTVFRFAETVLGTVFRDGNNPLYHLGALSFLFFWILTVSGLYLYIFFETSINGAYSSIETLSREQWYLGGIMRSMHRYGGDAMVFTVVLHMVREYGLGRYKHARWFAWLTGVVLLWLLFPAGISGYWLVWDELAQYVAIVTADWLDWLPIFSASMARNFISNASVNDRFFSLIVFLHIGVPIFLLFGMWIHIQRISRGRTNPPRQLIWGVLGALLVLSLAWPVFAQGQADLDKAVGTIELDWAFLFMYPLVELWGPGTVWVVSGVATVVLMFLPWLFPGPRYQPAVVDLDNCNGCGRCEEDCPYNAVTMLPRTDGKSYSHEAVVNTDQCTACGICVGACPTATPFRRRTDLIAGIDLPDLPVRELRDRTVEICGTLGTAAPRILIYGCRSSLDHVVLQEEGVATIEISCVGALSPTFVDFVLSGNHADGVMLVGCGKGDCFERFGDEWTRQRLAGERDPYLRTRVPRERIHLCWSERRRSKVRRELREFRAALAKPATEG